VVVSLPPREWSSAIDEDAPRIVPFRTKIFL
jgi:hypothetical protein